MGIERSAPGDAPGQVGHSIHALRNGMNSLLMNAAVLTSRADEFPESLRPFVERIAQAGHACSDELTRLYALVEEPKT